MSDTTRTTPSARAEIHVELLPGFPQQCQLFGHTWQHTTVHGAKVCTLCRLWGYCPMCTPIAPQSAQPFTCTAHTVQRQVQP